MSLSNSKLVKIFKKLYYLCEGNYKTNILWRCQVSTVIHFWVIPKKQNRFCQILI